MSTEVKLIKAVNPLLHKVSLPVPDEMFSDNSAQIVPIASLLIDQMYKLGGIGISACQLGIDLSIFAIDTDNQPRICINPRILAADVSGEIMEKRYEGCLTFPGLALKVNRPKAVAVCYKNLEGKEVRETLDGLTARAWLHEFDHTQGICFTDRVSKLVLDMAKRKLAKSVKRS